MSLEDKTKWDKKYRRKPKLLLPREASSVLKEYVPSGDGKKALDLACGAGRNTLYLAQEGYSVDAVDIAEVALATLEKEAKTFGVLENIMIILQDLETLEFKANSYDLIVMMNYLDRALIRETKTALKVGGRYIIETYMVDVDNEKEKSKQENLLQPQELKKLFSDGFKTLYYNEFENEKHELYRMKKAVIVVEKLQR